MHAIQCENFACDRFSSLSKLFTCRHVLSAAWIGFCKEDETVFKLGCVLQAGFENWTIGGAIMGTHLRPISKSTKIVLKVANTSRLLGRPVGKDVLACRPSASR